MRMILAALLLASACTAEATRQDVIDACMVRASEADCVDFADAYPDCLEEAYALAVDPCDSNRKELRQCAR